MDCPLVSTSHQLLPTHYVKIIQETVPKNQELYSKASQSSVALAISILRSIQNACGLQCVCFQSCIIQADGLGLKFYQL